MFVCVCVCVCVLSASTAKSENPCCARALLARPTLCVPVASPVCFVPSFPPSSCCEDGLGQFAVFSPSFLSFLFPLDAYVAQGSEPPASFPRP